MAGRNNKNEPPEKYFSDAKIAGKLETEELPSSKTGTAKGDHKLLLTLMWLLLAGSAAPLLLIHLISSPPPGEHLLIFGISYHQVLFAFFLGAALLFYVSLFFLKARPLTLFFFFILTLLSCFPFVVGLKNNLTLHQVILDISFFSRWPFFVRPAYLLIEFLIPLGILIYLSLQIISLFSRKPRGYAFLAVAIYLSVAAFLGISGLSQARQPNIGTALAYIRGNLAEKETVPVIGGSPPNLPLARELGNPPAANQARSPAPSAQMTPGVRSEDSGTGKTPVGTVLPVELGEIKTVSRELRFLSGKVEGLMVQLNEMKALFTARQESGEETSSLAPTQEKGGEEPSEEKRAILELRKELRLLSDKVDHIAEAFTQMGRVLAEQQGNMKKEGIGVGVERSGTEKRKEP